MRHLLFVFLLCSLCLPCVPASALAAEELEIRFMVSSGKQRSVWVEEIIKPFEMANPDITVKRREYKQEDYKAQLPGWLQTGDSGDICFWFAGRSLREFAQAGLLYPVGPWWAQHGWTAAFTEGSRSAVSMANEQYGLPMSYYQWGLYYNEQTLAAAGVQEPQTWEEFLAVAAALKDAGIAPIAMGAKNGWPAAGWFDYLNLRINGLAFHQSLLAGKIPFTDERVRAVFVQWAELAEKGYYNAEFAEQTWNEPIAALIRGKAGFYLMGNFIVSNFPDAKREEMRFARFPIIDPAVGIFEEAPMDILIVPASAKNPKAAERFLAYMATPEVQGVLNRKTGMIAPNTEAPRSDDRFIRAGAALLDGAEGLSQFFDRDTTPAMASAAMPIMVEFLQNPTDIDGTLAKLEAARQASF